MSAFFVRAAAFAVLVAAAPAIAADKAAEARAYSECLDLARLQPEQGWEKALAWGSLGGGEPARHCGAIALVALGHHQEAATRLERLAKESRRQPALRGQMLGQAAEAWMLAGQHDRALGALDAALALSPDDPELHIDRAVILAERKDYKNAIADLDLALKAAPRRADALALRAAGRRKLGDLKAAEEDVVAALESEPEQLDALLESGTLHQLRGDRDEARHDWLRILQISPDSAAADTARRNIENMDLPKQR